MTDPIQNDLLRTRALWAIAFAVARYVPIPLLDDLVRDRIALTVLRATAAARGLQLEKAGLSPLASPSDGCLGCLLTALWVPVKFILFPIRTLLAVVLGVRWASRDLLTILALGRTFDRLLDDGRFPKTAVPDVQAAFARDARLAFDRAIKGQDTQAVTGVLAMALGPLRKVVPAAIRLIRRSRTDEPATPVGADAPASRIVAALEEPHVRALLESIDTRFDQALLEIRAAGRGP